MRAYGLAGGRTSRWNPWFSRHKVGKTCPRAGCHVRADPIALSRPTAAHDRSGKLARAGVLARSLPSADPADSPPGRTSTTCEDSFSRGPTPLPRSQAGKGARDHPHPPRSWRTTCREPGTLPSPSRRGVQPQRGRISEQADGSGVRAGTRTFVNAAILRGTATGIRTPVSGLRIRRPSPLDDSGRVGRC